MKRLAALIVCLCAARAAAAPGPRLPDGVDPIAYDLTLSLDPDRETFRGHVEIRVRLARPTQTIWFHAAQLEIERARIGTESIPIVDDPAAEQMRALALPRPTSGEVQIAFDYTGRVDTQTGRGKDDAEGLFREQQNGRWYLYSQGESVFARRIAPCFDEPRWKVPWRVALVVPRGQVALANMPEVASLTLPGGLRAVQFAETAPLASYLVAVAVGPFALVDAGRVGRAKVPVRFAVAREDVARTKAAIALVPKLVDTLEQFTGTPLPWPKLDLVAVPTFFGAMENPGLVTLETATLVGDPGERFDRSRFLHVVGHELVHHWFGDSVTPAWWSDLWLSEAFATWLEARVSEQLGGRTADELGRHDDRALALAADAEPGAAPLHREIRSGADAESAFGAIAYEKGAAVLAMFERFVGRERFRGVVRAYLAAHTGGTATTADFLAAVSSEVGPELAGALRSFLDRAGAPVVALERRCPESGPAVLVAEARGGFTVPVCARTAAGNFCALVGAHTEIPLRAACPAWVIGNANALGYYQVVWTGSAPPLAQLEPAELLAHGDDVAAAVARGDVAVPAALAELTALAASKKPYAQLAALAIANEIDPIVGEGARPAWQAWLAARFPDRVAMRALYGTPHAEIDERIAASVVALVSRAHVDPKAVARAQHRLGAGTASARWELRLAGIGAGPDGLARIRELLASAQPGGKFAAQGEPLRALAAELLAETDPSAVSDAVAIVLGAGDDLPQLWPAIAGLLARPDARSIAWVVVGARTRELFAALQASAPTALFEATSHLCGPSERAEVAATLGPLALRVTGGPAALAASLASIDRCIARRAAAGDLAATLK